MVSREGFGCSEFQISGFRFFSTTVIALCVVHCLVSQPVDGLRPLRERARSWGDEWLFVTKDKSELGPFSEWNITGTYRGSWSFLDSTNSSSRFPDFRNSNGNSIIELISTPTKISGVHYVQGVVIFHDVIGNEHDVGGVQIKVEGVYIWPFRQLRMVANSGKGGEFKQEVDSILSNPYHLLGVFSSQVFQESPQDKMWRRSHSPIYEMEKHCNIEIAAQISHFSSPQNGSDAFLYISSESPLELRYEQFSCHFSSDDLCHNIIIKNSMLLGLISSAMKEIQSCLCEVKRRLKGIVLLMPSHFKNIIKIKPMEELGRT